MTDQPLSPAAAAVLAAYHKEAIDYIESWGSFSHKCGIAAALQAAADQVVPQRRKPMYADSWEESTWTAQQDIRAEFRAIAAELEAQ